MDNTDLRSLIRVKDFCELSFCTLGGGAGGTAGGAGGTVGVGCMASGGMAVASVRVSCVPV